MSGYIGSTPVPQATQHRESFTATEGQTSFATAGYTPQFVDVYLNGSHLSPADFTATNGSDVVLGVAASADDVCDIISYTPFEVADATFTGTTTFSGGFDSNDASSVIAADGASDNAFVLDVRNQEATAGRSLGLRIDAGSNTADSALLINDFNASNNLFRVKGSGAVEHIAGTAALPSITKFGDTNTGILFPAADTIGFSTAGTERMRIDAAGIITKPLQPAFFANPDGVQSNIPINASTNINFGTQRYDQNDDFQPSTGNGQGADTNNKRATFTAPVAGKYMLGVNLRLDAVDKDYSYFQIQIVATGRTLGFISSGGQLAADATYYTAAVHGLVEMDEGDTAYVKSYIPNSGAAQMDVSTSGYFYGYLVC